MHPFLKESFALPLPASQVEKSVNLSFPWQWSSTCCGKNYWCP